MNRVALIIGGASGIGLATTNALAKDHTVAVADVTQADSVVSTLPGYGHRAYAFNISDEAAVIRLYDSIENDLGPIAVLVNCAGVAGYVDGKRPTLRDTSLANWNGVFAVNSTGPFLCLRELFRRRAAKPMPDGRAILVGSMAALDGGKNSPTAYASSKGAVHALVKGAMNEATSLGITVNCVAPGLIDTPMFRSVVPAERRETAVAHMPFGRAGLPEEVAATIAFLASKQASFISGACIDVNGGARLT